MCGHRYMKPFTKQLVGRALGYFVVRKQLCYAFWQVIVSFAPVTRLYSYTNTALSLCVLLILMVSCKDSYTICDQSKQVNYKAGFYTKSGTVDVPTVPTSLTLTFPGASTFIYNQQLGISSFSLGLSPVVDSVKYVIKISNTLPSDTLTLRYTNGRLNLGPDCGDIDIQNFTWAHTTTNTLDSVKIVAASVNNVPKENLRIYY